MFSNAWKRIGGRAATVRTPKRARQGYRLLAELLEDRTVLSASRGGLESLSSPLQIEAAGQAGGSQSALVQATNGTGIRPRGPGYPLPPATGPALRGDLVASATTTSVPLPSQQSTASVLPLLLVGGGLSAPTAPAIDVAATTSLLAPQGVAASAPTTPTAPSVLDVSAAAVSTATANQAAAAPTAPSPVVGGSATGVAAQTVTAPVLTAALTTSVTAANPMAPAQGSVAMIGRTEGMRVVETAVISPLITADWMGLAPVTPPGTATLASSGVVGVEGAASVAAQLSAHTDAEPAEAKVLDVLFASSTKEDTRGAEQAAQVVMAGELPVVIAVPAAVAEPSAAVADGEQVLATSTATLVVPGTTLDRLFAEQGDEGTSTAFSGVRLVVPLLLAAGVCLAARRRTDGTTEPFVRLRTAHVTI